MVYKINVPLVGGGTRKKEIIDANNNLTIDEIRVESIEQKTFVQGSSFGYRSGGGTPNPSNGIVIDRFSFSADGNATDVGDLTQTRIYLSGASSETHGYSAGGYSPPESSLRNTIDKFPFATATANATDVGDLTQGKARSSGNTSPTHGYAAGGESSINTIIKGIDKYSLSSDGNGTDIGDLSQERRGGSSQSSTTSGYHGGGTGPTIFADNTTIDKFPFASDTGGTNVGDLSQARGNVSGNSSGSAGYASGGEIPSPYSSVNTIDKFPFASDGTATDVGDLITISTLHCQGQNSTVSGYQAGGNSPAISPGSRNAIQKFPFSSDANATDVGDLTTEMYHIAAGQQV